jgi:uncharacterized protein (TIGR02757 family)
MKNLKQLLENEVQNRNCIDELCYEKPDPLFIAKRYDDEYIALICALFGYGNAHSIIKFLDSLDFSLIEQNEKIIFKELQGFYYRFQSSDDVINFFIALKRLKEKNSLEDIFIQGYNKQNSVLEGIDKIIHSVSEELENYSEGLKFLVGTSMKRDKNYKIKLFSNGAYKRYNMFLRWMVRDDNLDMGLWKKVDTKDLIIPLDTHTFKVSQKLGLLSRKTYDLKAAVELTNKLKEFDPNDPVKYDFALYRLGQEKIIK